MSESVKMTAERKRKQIKNRKGLLSSAGRKRRSERSKGFSIYALAIFKYVYHLLYAAISVITRHSNSHLTRDENKKAAESRKEQCKIDSTQCVTQLYTRCC